MISVHRPNFILGLVCGITAATFIPLGITFLVVFGTMGLVFLAIGVVDAVVALVVFSRGRSGAARDEAARISHGNAQVVDAQHSWGTQVGARHPVKLTVDLSGAQRTQTLLVPGHIDWRAGETIAVRFAPNDPDNWVPVG